MTKLTTASVLGETLIQLEAMAAAARAELSTALTHIQPLQQQKVERDQSNFSKAAELGGAMANCLSVVSREGRLLNFKGRSRYRCARRRTKEWFW